MSTRVCLDELICHPCCDCCCSLKISAGFFEVALGMCFSPFREIFLSFTASGLVLILFQRERGAIENKNWDNFEVQHHFDLFHAVREVPASGSVMSHYGANTVICRSTRASITCPSARSYTIPSRTHKSPACRCNKL